MDVHQRKLSVARLSVISNGLLVVMKLVVGLAIGSVSVLSEAIHSGMDLLAALIAAFSVRTSSIPADARHPFGHGKVENISGTIEALLIFLAAVLIIFEATGKLLHPRPIQYVGWGVIVMFVSTAINIIVSERLFTVGRETDSIALQADGWHLRTDVYTSAAVMTSLAVIWLGHQVFPDPNVHWLDPVSALVVALLIIRAAYRLTIQSAKDLMDVKLPAEEETWIRQRIVTRRDKVRGYHHLRTRKAGNYRFVEFHIKVDDEMSVEASHRITKELKASIRKRFPDASVTIHVEPCDGNCLDDCLDGCLMTAEERNHRYGKGLDKAGRAAGGHA